MPQQQLINSVPSGGRHAARRGAVLLLVAVVMLTLSVLGLAVLSLADANGIQGARHQQTAAAFWIAEGGAHFALANLKYSGAYRASLTNLAGSLGNGVYSVSVIKAGTLHTITSAGNIANARRAIRMQVDVRDDGWPMAFADFSLFSGGGNIDVGKESSIYGDVYAGGTVYGSVVTAVGTNGSVRDSSTTTNTSPPEMPALNTAYYDAAIAQAAAYTGPALAYPLSLGGGTKYVNGNANIRDISGPGILAVKGDITLSKDVVIGDQVWLICGGTLSIAKGFQTGTNCLFFARSGIVISKEGLALDSCALITPASIDLQKAIDFNGIMYAGESISFDKDADVTGSIVAGTDIDADKDFSFVHDTGAFPEPRPPGFTAAVSIRQILWEDLGTGG